MQKGKQCVEKNIQNHKLEYLRICGFLWENMIISFKNAKYFLNYENKKLCKI